MHVKNNQKQFVDLVTEYSLRSQDIILHNQLRYFTWLRAEEPEMILGMRKQASSLLLTFSALTSLIAQPTLADSVDKEFENFSLKLVSARKEFSD